MEFEKKEDEVLQLVAITNSNLGNNLIYIKKFYDKVISVALGYAFLRLILTPSLNQLFFSMWTVALSVLYFANLRVKPMSVAKNVGQELYNRIAHKLGSDGDKTEFCDKLLAVQNNFKQTQQALFKIQCVGSVLVLSLFLEVVHTAVGYFS